MTRSPITYEEAPVFNGIGRRNLSALLGCLKSYTRSYSTGEFILLDQERVQHVGVVLSGMVHMIKEDPAGQKILLHYLEPGEIFGGISALRREPMTYVSFQAAAASTVLFLSMEHLVRPCQNNCPFHGRFAENVFQQAAEENLRLIEKIEVSSKGSLREKILCFLRQLAAKQGQKYISVPLSRTEMASYLQANRSAMTRELAAMRSEGLIDFDGSTFVLLC